MSYDVWMAMDCGGEDPMTSGDLNMTSNVSCMWRKAGADIAQMGDEQWIGERCIPVLRAAIATIQDDMPTYRAMNPPNGWGDVDSCIKFLRGVLDLCIAYPKATLRVSR